MSSAYGHMLRPMAAAGSHGTKAFHTAYHRALRQPHWRPDKAAAGVMVWAPNCSGRDCDGEPVYASRYSYVTGRAGRVTDRVQYWCTACAALWSQRHGCELPALPVAAVTMPAPRQAPSSELNALIDQFFGLREKG